MNEHSFIAPNWRPFDVIPWVLLRTIRKSQKGGSLQNGFVFFENSLGFHAKSYDNGMIRKLSFTLCLNEDYEGGNFSVSSPHPISEKTKIETIDKPKKGTMIVFPSYTWHKVDKITSGIRKTLVGWVVGKEWS